MDDNIRENIEKEAKRIEEDCLYSAKGHFIAADFWRNFHLRIGASTAILAAISSASALSKFDNHNLVASILAIIVTALVAVTTFLNPNEKANAHLSSGNKYNAIRNKARMLYGIRFYTVESERELALYLEELAGKRDELNENSPQIPRWAYTKARKGIEKGDANYGIDHL